MLLFHSYLLGAQSNKHEGSFLKKDDPKINALMQQAELLSSLALKVNTENTDQSLENAWKVRSNLWRFRYQSSPSIACLGMFHQVSTNDGKIQKACMYRECLIWHQAIKLPSILLSTV